MGHLFEIFVSLFLNLLYFAYSDDIRPCGASNLGDCGEHEFCNETLNMCECMEGFIRVGADCVIPSSDSSSSTATVVVVVIFVLALILCGLFLIIRKYNLIEYIQRYIDIRRNNDSLYEDVMIDQDDPPLRP